MHAKVVWKGNMSFDGTADSGFTLPLGASPEAGGTNDGFRPMELLAIGLAGCTALDVISILNKKRQDVTAFEVHVQAERATDHPREFTHISIEYQVTGRKLEKIAVDRSVELSVTKYCSAMAMLSKAVPIENHVTILNVD